MKKYNSPTKLLLSYFLYVTQALASGEHEDLILKINQRCLINDKNKFVSFTFTIQDSARLSFYENLECLETKCFSERIYFNNQNQLVGTHKYSAKILNMKKDPSKIEIIYEGSDPGQKRKLTLNLMTKKLSVFEYGQTVLSQNEYADTNESTCKKLEIIK